MKHDRAFVRRCQSVDCSRVFVDGESACAACGRFRSERSWRVEILGCFRGEHVRAEDALDHAFNEDVFVGHVRGQLLRVSDDSWRVTNIVMRFNDGIPLDGTEVVADSLVAFGLPVESATPSGHLSITEPALRALTLN